MNIDIGIPAPARDKISAGLARLLADSYSLYLKTHYYHWNVTGPMFQTLHLMFETQYTELATAIDEIAERIRALGAFAPGTYGEFSKLSSIQQDSEVPAAREMIKNLVLAHESVIRTARQVFAPAEEGHDEATADLLTTRIRLHEKTAWMLRSLLAD